MTYREIKRHRDTKPARHVTYHVVHRRIVTVGAVFGELPYNNTLCP